MSMFDNIIFDEFTLLEGSKGPSTFDHFGTKLKAVAKKNIEYTKDALAKKAGVERKKKEDKNKYQE